MSLAPLHLLTGNLNFYSLEWLGRSKNTQLVAVFLIRKEMDFLSYRKQTRDIGFSRRGREMYDQRRMKGNYVG